MRVLVTGASGFLGRHALACLRLHGIDTVVLGRSPPAGVEDANFIQADLLSHPNFPELIAASGASHLLHLAWYAEHGKYWTSPLNLQWVDATVRLAQAFCEAGGRHVVMAGTCAEYDWAHGYCREDATPCNPATLYGVAKDAAHRLVATVCAQHRTPCAWGRIFLPFGAGENRQRLIPSLIEVLQGRRAPFGVNADAYRDFLHASDVAEGFVALLQSDAAGAYNLSSGQPLKIADLVRAIGALLGADPMPVLDLSGARPGEPPLLAGECLKMKALGWQPALSLLGGLERTLASAAADERI